MLIMFHLSLGLFNLFIYLHDVHLPQTDCIVAIDQWLVGSVQMALHYWM